MEWMRRHLTYANVMATVAVFGMLGGGAYAITTAKKNSVTSKSVRNGSIKGLDVLDESLSGQDVNESTLSLPTGPKGDQGSPGAPGSPDTPQQVLDKLKLVDGNGSGLDADTLDGGHACRTDGVLRMQVGEATKVACSRGAFTLTADCIDGSAGSISGEANIDTSIDNAFYRGPDGNDDDFDDADGVSDLLVVTASTASPEFRMDNVFAAAPDGTQLSGVIGVRVGNVSGTADCEFGLGALG